MDLNISNNTCTSIGNSYSVLEATLILVITSVLNFLTIIGNLLFIISFHTNEKLKTLDNYFLLSLAVSDFIIGTISMPLYTSYFFMEKWSLNPVICYSWVCLDYFCKNASILVYLMMLYERYLSKKYSAEYRNKRRVAMMIAFSWICSFLIFPGLILLVSLFEPPPPESRCYIKLVKNNLIKILLTVITFWLPILGICKCYREMGRLRVAQHKKKEARVCTHKKMEQLSSSEPNNPVSELRYLSGNLATIPRESSYKFSPPLMSPEENQKTCYHKYCLSLFFDIYYDDGDDDNNKFDETTSSSEENPTQSPKKSAEIPRQKQIGQKNILRNESADSDNLMIKESGTDTIMINEKEKIKGIPDHKMITLKNTNVVKTSMTDQNDKTHISKEAGRIMKALSLTLVFTHCPYNYLILFRSLADCFDYKDKDLYDLFFYLCYMNSFLHPICYALANSDIRKAYWKILTCTWKQ